MSFPVDLQVPEGTHLSLETVNLTIEIKAYTEKSFELPIISHNLPGDRSLRFFPASVEIICQVALDNYAQLTETNLEISVDYADLIRNKNTTTALTLSKKPQWLIDYRIIPERVEYLIEQRSEQ
jgi:hypothetical protein